MSEIRVDAMVERARSQRLLPRLRELPYGVALLLFGALVGAYVGGAMLAGVANPPAAVGAPFGTAVVVRMNFVTITIITYCVTVGLLEFRHGPHELARLRGLLDCDDATFADAVDSMLPGRSQTAAAIALGGAFGAGVTLASMAVLARLGRSAAWGYHDSWNVALTLALFALLGWFASWSLRTAGLYSSLSREHARVDLLDSGPFALFATRGLRHALFWFGGSGIALLLVQGAQARDLILATIALTFALGVASLVSPSRGIHQRVQVRKSEELARVRGEIAASLTALRAGAADAGARLPALIAWEARVEAVPEWPISGGVLLRFALFVLIPLGSWLGGALVERLVDHLLG